MMDTSDTSFGDKVRGFISQLKQKHIFAIVGILVLVAAVPLTVLNLQQEKDIRQQASGEATVTVSPTTVNAGANVTVNWTIAQPAAPTPTNTPVPIPNTPPAAPSLSRPIRDCAPTQADISRNMNSISWPQAEAGIARIEMSPNANFSPVYKVERSSFRPGTGASVDKFWVRNSEDFSDFPGTLQINTTYHYRLVRSNGALGTAATFRIPNCGGTIIQTFLPIPKAYAQTTLTGGEKLILYRINLPQSISEQPVIGSEMYLNCQPVPVILDNETPTPVPPTTPVYTGQCTYPIPATAQAGTYVIKLFPTEGATPLGVSAPFTVGSTTAPTATLTPTPPSTTTAYNGICIVRTSSTNMPTTYAAPTSGTGYQKINKPNVSSLDEVRTQCTGPDYVSLMPLYCQANTQPAIEEVALYDKTTGNFLSSGCAGGQTCITSACPVTVTNTLTASPNPCQIAAGQTNCTSRISWNVITPGAGDIVIKIRSTGQGFAGGAISGTADAWFVNENGVTLDLYKGATVLKSITVYGNPPPSSALQPVYIMKTKTANPLYFYTASVVEKNILVDNNQWVTDGPGWFAYTTPHPTLNPAPVPIYRLYLKSQGGVHFFTASAAEKDQAIQTGLWTLEGTGSWYAFTTQQPNTFPVYRLHQASTGYYAYTIDEAEKNRLIQAGYTLTPTPIAWYAYKTGTTNAAITFSTTTFLTGIGAPSGTSAPRHPTRTVFLSLWDSTNKPVATKTATITYVPAAGNFTGQLTLNDPCPSPVGNTNPYLLCNPAGNTNLPAGSYTIKLYTPQFLRKQVPGIFTINAAAPFTLPSLKLLPGDVNLDNILDILDYNMLMNCYGNKINSQACLGTPQFTNWTAETPATPLAPLADLNDDGVVDGIDYNLFIRSLGTQKGD